MIHDWWMSLIPNDKINICGFAITIVVSALCIWFCKKIKLPIWKWQIGMILFIDLFSVFLLISKLSCVLGDKMLALRSNLHHRWSCKENLSRPTLYRVHTGRYNGKFYSTQKGSQEIVPLNNVQYFPEKH